MTPTREPADHEMARVVRDWLRETALTGPEAQRGIDKLLTDFPTTPQRRRWWRIAWPDRGRDVSRSVTGRGTTSPGRSSAMYGPIRLVVASMIVAIVGGIALIRFVEPPPPLVLLSGATLVVAPEGSADFTTIAAAVEAAADGDTIQVMPGHYRESVPVVGKDLTITGVGDRDAIIVEAMMAAPPAAALQADAARDTSIASTAAFDWAFFLLDTSTTLSNLTVIGQEEGTAIPIAGEGSAPTLDGLVIRIKGQWTGGHAPVWWDAGAGGVLRNSVVEGFIGVRSAADVILEDNEMPSTCVLVWQTGAHATIRRNDIRDCPYGFGIKVERGSAIIEGNDIAIAESDPGLPSAYSEGRVGILVVFDDAPTTVRDNTVHDSAIGISAGNLASAEIIGNQVHGNAVGINASSDDVTLRDNMVNGNTVGVTVGLGSPTLAGNTITGNESGLRIGRGTPTLTGNTICDNGTNLFYGGEGEPPPTAGNEICPDASPAASSGS